MLNIAEVIGKGHDWLRNHGWIKDELRYEEKVCSYGGLLIGAGWLNWDEEEETETSVNVQEGHKESDIYPVARFLLVHGIGLEPDEESSPVQQIVTWNDNEETSEQMVLDAFAKAEKVALAGFDPEEGVK